MVDNFFQVVNLLNARVRFHNDSFLSVFREVLHNDPLVCPVVTLLNVQLAFDLADDLELFALLTVIWKDQLDLILVVQKEVMRYIFHNSRLVLDFERMWLQIDGRLLKLCQLTRGVHGADLRTREVLVHFFSHLVVKKVDVMSASDQDKLGKLWLSV